MGVISAKSPVLKEYGQTRIIWKIAGKNCKKFWRTGFCLKLENARIFPALT